MTAIAERDAKNRFLPFVADATDKQRRASADVRSAVESVVSPTYDALEDCRSGGYGRIGRDAGDDDDEANQSS